MKSTWNHWCFNWNLSLSSMSLQYCLYYCSGAFWSLLDEVWTYGTLRVSDADAGLFRRMQSLLHQFSVQELVSRTWSTGRQENMDAKQSGSIRLQSWYVFQTFPDWRCFASWRRLLDVACCAATRCEWFVVAVLAAAACKRRLIPGQVIGSCSPARCVLHSELYHACTMLVLSGGNKISFMASYFPIHVIFTALPAVLLLFAAKFQKLWQLIQSIYFLKICIFCVSPMTNPCDHIEVYLQPQVAKECQIFTTGSRKSCIGQHLWASDRKCVEVCGELIQIAFLLIVISRFWLFAPSGSLWISPGGNGESETGWWETFWDDPPKSSLDIFGLHVVAVLSYVIGILTFQSFGKACCIAVQ